MPCELVWSEQVNAEFSSMVLNKKFVAYFKAQSDDDDDMTSQSNVDRVRTVVLVGCTDTGGFTFIHTWLINRGLAKREQ